MLWHDCVMFWSRKNKGEKSKGAKQDKRHKRTGDGVQRNSKSVGTSKGQRAQTSEDIRKQALANAQQARENLGDETVQRIAEIMSKKDHTPMARAKADIAAADSDRVLDELKFLLDQKH